MSRKKKNQTRNNKPSVSTSENSQFNNNRNGNLDNNEKSISDYHLSDSSSDSGKSEFDEEYQRNRPPLIPIDPSRIRPIKAQNSIIDNSIANDLLKNNEDEIDVKTNKLSKSKRRRLRLQRRRLRRQRKRLGNPSQSNDVTSVSSTMNTQPIIVVEMASKQEFNDFIEHPNNVINSEKEMTTNNKKRRRNPRRRKKSPTSIQPQIVLEETDENVEKYSSNTQVHQELDWAPVQLFHEPQEMTYYYDYDYDDIWYNFEIQNSLQHRYLYWVDPPIVGAGNPKIHYKHNHTFAEELIKETVKMIGEILFPMFKMTSTI